MLTILAAATTQPTSKPAVMNSVKKVATDATQGVWDMLNQEAFLYNSWLAWGKLFASILIALIVTKLVSIALKKYSHKMMKRKKLKVAGMLFEAMGAPLTLLGLGYGLKIGGTFLKFHPPKVPEVGGIEPLYFQVVQTIIAIAVIWFLCRAVKIIEHFMMHMAGKTETTLDDQLIPLVRKSLRIVIILMGLLYIAANIYDKDIDVILGSLGIGGFAIALASKDMLANLFGSVAIFTDKPFAIGQRIKIKGYDGIVEEVGFRSTRLRTLSGHYVTIPNSIITNEVTENISLRPSIKRNLCVTIEYSTPIDKIQKGVDILRGMLDARQEHFEPGRPGWVHFTEMNSDNLEIRVTYWFAPCDWEKYLEFNHDFQMELMRKFEAEGIEFAFPTQTLHVFNENKD